MVYSGSPSLTYCPARMFFSITVPPIGRIDNQVRLGLSALRQFVQLLVRQTHSSSRLRALLDSDSPRLVPPSFWRS